MNHGQTKLLSKTYEAEMIFWRRNINSIRQKHKHIQWSGIQVRCIRSGISGVSSSNASVLPINTSARQKGGNARHAARRRSVLLALFRATKFS